MRFVNLCHSTAEKFVRGLSLAPIRSAQTREDAVVKKDAMSIVVAIVTFFPVNTRAQSPRDYLNTPVDAALLQLDFLNSNTETASASDLPLPNNLAVSRLGSASLLWSFPLADRYGGVAVTGGYIKVKVTGPLGQIETTGFSDPGMTFHAKFSELQRSVGINLLRRFPVIHELSPYN